MDFLRTILIILLVFFALRFSWKLAKPYLMRYIARKMGERFEKSFGANPFGNSPFENKKKQEEGTVTIDRDAPNSRKTSNKVGDYVDFEEVE